ncbi:MAG: ABC transporter ATP-binding protein/permease [Atopostipes sp.]|nr:ABC transporter ATP-binding protein/permease [Atopostipes sp.]
MEKERKNSINRLLALLSDYKLFLISILLLSIVQVALAVYLPILIGEGVDNLVGAGQVHFDALKNILLKMLVVVLVNTIVQWILPMIYQKISYELTRDLRQEALEKIHSMPLSAIDQRGTGDLVSRLTTDTEQLNDGILMTFEQLLIGILTILFTLVMMFRLNRPMMLIVALLTPLSLFVSRFIAQKSYEYFTKSVAIRGDQSEIVEESISQNELVTLFNIFDRKETEFNEINDQYSEYSEKAIFYSSTVNPTTRFVNALIYAVVAFMGVILILGNALTVGGLTVFLNYAKDYTKPFNDISSVLAELQSALASAERLFEIIDSPVEEETGFKEYDSSLVAGKMSFNDVDFSYTEEESLIEDLNLEIEPGMNVAIVGPTGAGKSTLINLIMRFYELDAGEIVLDGEKIRDYTRSSLREQLGMVLQEVWLKSGTVHENIAYGHPDISREEVVQAAKSAHAHKFIQALPNGYDTVLTEGGTTLSKGEQQLLSIARIFVSIPNILILDEATSSIDTRTELEIQAAFQKLMEGRTSFVIAHRLSTIQDSDLILVMQEGQVVEQGTHQELIGNQGLYYQMQIARSAEAI